MNSSFHDRMSLMSGVILLFCLLGHVLAGEFDVEPNVDPETFVMGNEDNSDTTIPDNDGFIIKFTDE